MTTLKHTYPEHVLTNTIAKHNTSHETTIINAIIMVERLLPSFGISNNLSNEPMFSKYFINLQSHGTPRSLYCLKKTNDYMTRFSLVIQKMHSENECSTFAVDIHKSKLMVQELQNFKVLAMHFSLVVFTILKKKFIGHVSPRWKSKMRILFQK